MQRTTLLGAFLLLAGCYNPASSDVETRITAQSESEVALIGAAELAQLLEQDKVILVDVRTPAEFAEARLHGALNAPLQTFDPAMTPQEELRETILYCRSSGRSGRAAKILADHLGKRVRHMEGGIIAWQDAGLPTVSQP